MQELTDNQLNDLNKIKENIIWTQALSTKRISRYIHLFQNKKLCNPHNDTIDTMFISDNHILNILYINRELSIFGCTFRLYRKRVSTFEYFSNWNYFTSMNFINSNKSEKRLSKCIERYIKESEQNPENTIAQLWQDQWILGRDTYINLQYMYIKGDLSNEMIRTYNIVKTQIQNARINVLNLDEWFKELFKIMPIAYYGMFIAKQSKSEEAEKYERYFDEVTADIFGIMGNCLRGVILNKPNILTDELLEPNDDDNNTIKMKLSTYYRGRVMIPKFWFELAINNINKSNKDDRLNQFDAVKLASMIYLIEPSFLEVCIELSTTNKITHPNYRKSNIVIEP